MPIVFEHVSYDYNYVSPKEKKRGSKQTDGDTNTSAQALRTPQALNDICIEIPDGQFVGIIGHTGSGKSTLIQHINGLLQPTEGRVIVEGLDLAERANRRLVRKHVGIAFQYPEYQLFATTVEEDVSFGPRNLGLDSAEVDRRVRNALERVGLEYDLVAAKSPFHLSGGQQRRVALAGILAMEPKTLVLDEPMAGLDPKGRADTLALVHRLHAEGLTVVMVSHSMEDVAENAERVLVLEHGTIAMDGKPDEVFSHAEELREMGLGIPQATKFQNLLAKKGFEFKEPVHTLDDLANAIALKLGKRTKEEYLAKAAQVSAEQNETAQADPEAQKNFKNYSAFDALTLEAGEVS
ncbi:MAG: energy-coupling factor transporter ATPase [Coriobacteriales bacterium]|nr:energy-coupling factor transporter ATPase [Coriobacteriales bacterium]